MSKKRRYRKDNLVGGLMLIGAGLGWLAGHLAAGLLIGLGSGLVLSALLTGAEDGEPAGGESGAGEADGGEAGPAAAPAEGGEASEAAKPATPDIEVVWARILAHQGQVFHQVKGQAFTYEVSGDALIPSTASAKIYKSQFAKALEAVPFSRVSDVPRNVFGPSYVYAILMDPRIRNGDW